MRTDKNQIIITHDDYETLSSYSKGHAAITKIDRKDAASLQTELQRAVIVKNEELPEDIVRLNSRVIIQEEKKNKLIDIVLVLPEKANIKAGKVSVFAPIGTALLGFKQGSKVKWDVPAGSKTFKIIKVSKPESGMFF